MPHDAARIERIEQGERAQEHALARAGRPGDRDAVACVQGEGGRLQQRLAAHGIAPGDAVGEDEGNIGHE